MQLQIDNSSIELDKEGFLKNLNDWNKSIATEIAAREGITLTAEHWEIIGLVRDFYQHFQLSPSMRALVKRSQQLLGTEKGQSIYLLQLFPSSPAKLACKIAGLPKPSNCL
ncbi:MAG TPA: TusE/DsrC/DsvC family sulfur relay protein [Cellvibrio sp.]|nr:TusE/DsrC/DsvC family sulfur relay protein [Cellvibrio sp.]